MGKISTNHSNEMVGLSESIYVPIPSLSNDFLVESTKEK